MKKIFTLLILSAIVISPVFGQKKKKKKSKGAVAIEQPTSLIDSLSYSFGVSFAKNLLNQKELDTLNVKFLQKAIEDVIVKKNSYWDEKQATQIISKYFAQKKDSEGKKNRQLGEGFLTENGKREEVKTTASGLQYEILREGDGDKNPIITDKVKVHYHGTLIDGTVFDSSVDRGQPASFPVNAVIRGWVEALQLMKKGDKWKLFIPQDLAYGARATGRIPAYSALIFEVELLEIE